MLVRMESSVLKASCVVDTVVQTGRVLARKCLTMRAVL